jgi:hypothetical protein
MRALRTQPVKVCALADFDARDSGGPPISPESYIVYSESLH